MNDMRIIIVEDEIPIREGMENLCNKISDTYSVVGTAENGKIGLELIEQLQPDLVIFDIQMPEMDGLEMFRNVREKKVPCRAIVISAYTDFSYAKEAIDLGIEGYLLKPIKIKELKKLLTHVEEALQKDVHEEEQFSFEKMCIDVIHGQGELGIIQEILEERYQLKKEESLGIFALWFGRKYVEYSSKIKNELEKLYQEKCNLTYRVVCLPDKEMILTIFYPINQEYAFYDFLENKIVEATKQIVPRSTIFAAEECESFVELKNKINIIEERLHWNLGLKPFTLICMSTIDRLDIKSLKYPKELEGQIEKAVITSNKAGFKACFYKLVEHCKSETYDPTEIKEICLQYCWFIVGLAKKYIDKQDKAYAQSVMNIVSNAKTWEEIWSTLCIFSREMMEEQKPESQANLLITQAKNMIQEYYSEGINLEEVSEKLHVSGEYLSTIFKRETGVTFSEMLRTYKIEKIKELLETTSLKLNQISSLAGYSDSKYMSKVFKEQVGVLPSEYRKMKCG